MMNKKFTVIALVSTLFASAASASVPSPAPSQSSYTIELRGYVPVICRAQVSATQASGEAGTVSLGQLNEFCNNSTGYEVWVDYSPNLANASLIVDGQAVQLSEAGTIRVSHSDHAAFASHDLSLDLPEGVSGGAMSVRVVPL